mgnify:FL=1
MSLNFTTNNYLNDYRSEFVNEHITDTAEP